MAGRFDAEPVASAPCTLSSCVQVACPTAQIQLRGCLIEGGLAEGAVGTQADRSSSVPSQALVVASIQSMAVLQQCTLLWHGLPLHKPPSSQAPRLPRDSSGPALQPQGSGEARHAHKAAAGVAEGVEGHGRGPVAAEGGCSDEGTESEPTFSAAMVQSHMQGHVQLSRCELRAVEGDSHAGCRVRGVDVDAGSVVAAAQCSLSGCGMAVRGGSTLSGSHLKLAAGSMDSRDVGNCPVSVLCAVSITPGSTCRLKKSQVTGFQQGVHVSLAERGPLHAYWLVVRRWGWLLGSAGKLEAPSP